MAITTMLKSTFPLSLLILFACSKKEEPAAPSNIFLVYHDWNGRYSVSTKARAGYLG